ncbi:MAG: Asp-tRNA(Asn)/Glu-tRNA(Gln) amidotransferase subunit GatA [Actinomycetaceae bacterium]|nr:Asp-tRNA(Asn)/Glu-tRNA(Gln) amidotransferase subunit GatA [Actinomycetaceae bacterium]
MKDIVFKTAAELSRLLASGELSSLELTKACLERIRTHDPKIHAFLHVDADGALETAAQVDARRAAGEKMHPLAGIPVALKDNIVIQGMPTTCASKMLEGWESPYDATVVVKLKEAGLPIVGKTNMDEFAMGSSTENSAFGATLNPWNTERIPGGSGGGSAAAVAAYMVPLALGTDTGGSIRQPGACTGTVGAKPTYGAVSRYGAVAMASSLDQIGPVARTVEDAAMLQELLGGHDVYDSTSLPDPVPDLSAAVCTGAAEANSAKGLRVGIIKQLSGEGYQAGVLETFNATVQRLKDAGATVVEVDCPSFEYSLAAYYLIMPAEVSSNLARFDGVRYGLRVEPSEGPVTAETMMAATRGAGFGDEVKRRIILGTHVLSAGFFDAYYGSALKVRTLVLRDLAAAFEKVDVLVTPTAPTTAFKFGENADNLLAMYLNDVATLPANMAGIPAISIPVGLAPDDSMPVGFQILAPAKEDARMYKVAALVEAQVRAADLLPACPAKNWKDEA